MVELSDMNTTPKKVQFPDENEGHNRHKQRQRGDATGEGNTTLDNLMYKLFMHYCHSGLRLGRQFILYTSQNLANLHIRDLVKELRVWVTNHPLAAIIVTIIAFACGIPILIFVTFAIITIVFTFGGFLIIEGAVLAAGSFALLLCLSTMAVAFVSLGFVGGILYITYMQIDSMVRNNTMSGETALQFDSRLPQVLASLRNLPHTNHHRHDRVMRGSLSSHTNNGHVHLHSK